MELATVVKRVGRAFDAARQRPADQDLYFDAVVLNLHDFYTGLERLFQQICCACSFCHSSAPPPASTSVSREKIGDRCGFSRLTTIDYD
jgi:hypothetical protein